MKNIIIEFFLSLLLGFGTILLFSPLVLNWWIHGDYKRYGWIINDPYPYSNFGSGPFQMVMHTGLFLLGIILLYVSLIGRKLYNKSKEKNSNLKTNNH